MHEHYHLYRSQIGNGKELAFYSSHGYLLGLIDLLSDTLLDAIGMDVVSFHKYQDWGKFCAEQAHSLRLEL